MTDQKSKLSLTALTLIAIGSTIGSGIFLTPQSIAAALPSSFWILFVWAIGGIVALSGALTFAGLGTRFPQAGGVYVYLKEAYGPLVAFLYGWAYLVVVNTGAIAALSVGFSTYLVAFLQSSFPELGVSAAWQTPFAIGGIVIVTALNLKSVKHGGMFSNVFTVLKLAGIAGVILTGIFWGGEALDLSVSIPTDLETGFWSAIGIALIGVFWSYGGWQHASFLASDAQDPKRNVPRAMVMGALVITTTYLLTNFAYLKLLPASEIALTPEVAAVTIQSIFGSKGGAMIALIIFISTFGTAGIYTMSAPRIYYAMAQDKVFFKKIGEIHPQTGTPIYAILMQSVWAIILILLWGTFASLIKYVVFTDWIFMTLAAASIFIFRRKISGITTFLFPIPPLIFISVSVWFIINTLVNEPKQAIAGLVLLGIGALLYLFWKPK